MNGTGLGQELGNDNAPAAIRPWWYTRRGQDPAQPRSGVDSGFSVLDFPLFSTFRDNIGRGSFAGIGSQLGSDWVYGDATKLVTFFQNHDVGPDNDFKFRFQGESWKAAMAYNLLWTIRGIPCLYYGEEIEFQKGLPQDVDGSSMTLEQTGRAYFGDHLLPQALVTTQTHPLYQHIKRLNAIRRAIPALQTGVMSQVREWGAGMSFVREDAMTGSYVVVGLAAEAPQTVNVQDIKNGLYRDAITGREVQVSDGRLSFSVKEHAAGIYVLNGAGKIGSDGAFLR